MIGSSSALTGLAFCLTDTPDVADVKLIEDRLDAFNAEHAPPTDRQPLCVFVRSDKGVTLGGVTGYTEQQWLYLDCFWLPDELRARSGVGSHILVIAENEARRRGCGHVRLYTYSFQAPHFYAARGYERFGELVGFPPGHSQIWLKKTLDCA